jgi:hypothetical protein
MALWRLIDSNLYHLHTRLFCTIQSLHPLAHTMSEQPRHHTPQSMHQVRIYIRRETGPNVWLDLQIITSCQKLCDSDSQNRSATFWIGNLFSCPDTMVQTQFHIKTKISFYLSPSIKTNIHTPSKSRTSNLQFLSPELNSSENLLLTLLNRTIITCSLTM